MKLSLLLPITWTVHSLLTVLLVCYRPLLAMNEQFVHNQLLRLVVVCIGDSSHNNVTVTTYSTCLKLFETRLSAKLSWHDSKCLKVPQVPSG